MSVTFNGNVANRLTYSGGIVTGYPLTILAVGKPASVTGQRVMVRVGNHSGGTEYCRFLDIQDGDARAGQYHSGVAIALSSKSGMLATVEHKFAATFTSDTVRDIYVDGVVGTRDTTSVSLSGGTIDFVSVGVWAAADGTFVSPWSGDLSEVAIYAAVLTPEEITAWQNGASIKRLRSGAMRAYWAMTAHGTQANACTNTAYQLTETGTLTTGTHPTVAAFSNDGSPAVLLANQRYLTIDGSTARLLAERHDWTIMQDWASTYAGLATAEMDWRGYIDVIAAQGATSTHLWKWDHILHNPLVGGTETYIGPHPFTRTGGGTAQDGQARFDLDAFNSTYFTRLTDRLAYLATKGMFGSVMLFEGAWAAASVGDTYRHTGQLYYTANNSNGIAAATAATAYSRADAAINAKQEAYVAHVLDTIKAIPNAMIEVCNEPVDATEEWQEYWVTYCRKWELDNASTYRHLIMRSPALGSDETNMRASTATTICPSAAWSGYSSHGTPEENGDRVILLDSDHIDAAASSLWTDEFWRAFCRGCNVSYMDDPAHILFTPAARDQATPGTIARYAARLALALCVPNGALASTGYCLANPGVQYLAYQPGSAAFTLDLTALGGSLRLEWLNTNDGSVQSGGTVAGGGATTTVTPPFAGSPSGIVALLGGTTISLPVPSARPRIYPRRRIV